MTFRRAAAALAVCCLSVWSAPAAERYMAVSEITPGMTGVGRTAFTSRGLDEFTVHILGVLRNTNAPGRDLILARLEGGPLAKTGVIAGMSGSPVYVDGRMIGAVAYSLGNFPTEPIAGITPIAEMLDAARLTSTRLPVVPVGVPPHITNDTFLQAMTTIASSRAGWTAARALGATSARGPIDPAQLSTLRPIATPIGFGGFSPDAIVSLAGVLAQAGFAAAPAAYAPQTAAVPAPVTLRPGDPVGALLAHGDYDIGATGTVTEVDGSRVYAFGHPLFGLGPTRVPMATASVQAILPSLMSSVRIASTGSVIGTFTQDRATVLAGTLGPGPDTIPLTIGLTGPDGRRRELRLSMIDDQFFTPLLAYVAVGGALSTFERDLGVNTYAVRGSISVRGHAPVTFDDVFSGDAAASSAAATLSVPLAALESNDRETARIEGLTLEVATTERERSSTIERVWIDAPDVRAGRAVPIKILMRPFRGPEEVRTVVASLPSWVRGPLTLVVSNGASLAQYEAREGRTTPIPTSIAQLLSQVRQVKHNNRLYVRIYGQGAGAMVAGEALTSLPNSVLAIVEGDRASGGTTAVSSALIGAWDIPVDVAVTGMRTLTLTPVAARLP